LLVGGFAAPDAITVAIENGTIIRSNFYALAGASIAGTKPRSIERVKKAV
jgi:hypothetical protein